MKVVFCCSEVVPYAKTGGLADVCGSLPRALSQEGVDVSIIMPFYRRVQEHQLPLKSLGKDVLMLNDKGIDIFFVKNEGCFNRDGLYGTPSGDYGDNLERFSFFSKYALQLLKDLQQPVDVIHCHDWQTSLIPIYLKYNYQGDPFFQKTKTVLTIHNLAYQGVFHRDKFFVLGLPHYLNSMEGLEYYGQISLLKGGILFSDQITTVSPQYAQEIQTRDHGRGLEGVIRLRAENVVGILNGIDADYWNPEQDGLIAQKYNFSDLSGKAKNKKVLQEKSGLRVSGDIPVFGFVGRLSEQKGVDIFAQSIDEMMKHDVQLIFQGIGEDKYQHMLRDFQRRFPGKIAVHIKFDEALAHQIYAGSDILMMPSIYEPCGLSQMVAFRYGTIPLVHHTGGLVDTVMPFKFTAN
ncbi:MAG: glycogen/starch synthase, partial [Candidatus Omnitrophica bacterium]|nr:glycogen/starch synthase [Candidatus Omnitrophota bacterium]